MRREALGSVACNGRAASRPREGPPQHWKTRFVYPLSPRLDAKRRRAPSPDLGPGVTEPCQARRRPWRRSSAPRSRAWPARFVKEGLVHQLTGPSASATSGPRRSAPLIQSKCPRNRRRRASATWPGRSASFLSKQCLRGVQGCARWFNSSAGAAFLPRRRFQILLGVCYRCSGHGEGQRFAPEAGNWERWCLKSTSSSS